MPGRDSLADLSRRMRVARSAILAGQPERPSFIVDAADFAHGPPATRVRIEAALQDCRALSDVLAGLLQGYIQGRRRTVVGETGYGGPASLEQSLVNKRI
ncbi:hypothetical protein VK792_10030 [Mesobacterium sp. TK19101]|uniref:Uncharacterized protein n=1 Tax=Mesobacterium hydrothermale TaxID=3111907 RepID=A0ABU6HGS9_9RHOB|nr:hypothetical protein [Mesobacterium sp. TK19101]MEC3861622.1 hypothetical protein [Mesobacterium sp. TK19101]